MKKHLLTIAALLLLLTSGSLYSLNNFNYKGIALDSAGQILPSSAIEVRITISTSTGGVLYQETHSGITTDQFGGFTVEVGSGTVVSGSLSGITTTADTRIKVETRVVGGASWVLSKIESLSDAMDNSALNNIKDFAWALKGNTGTTPGTDYLGTSDDKEMRIEVRNGDTVKNSFRMNNNLAIYRETAMPGIPTGNARGRYAVDLQIYRDSANQVASGKWSVIGGGRGNVASGDSSVVAGGSYNQVLAAMSTIGGGWGNVIPVDSILYLGSYLYHYGNTISGGYGNKAGEWFSTVAGGAYNAAPAWSSTVGGGQLDTASGGGTTVSGGVFNKAEGDGAAIGGGWTNKAKAESSVIAGGAYNKTEGPTIIGPGQNWSSTIGGGAYNLSKGRYSTIPGGYYGKTDKFGQLAYASGAFADTGDAQTSLFVVRNETSDATPTVLYLDGTSASEEMTLNDQDRWTFRSLVIGSSDDGSSYASYIVTGVIIRNGGTVTINGVTTNTVYETSAGYNATAVVSGTALAVQVTGDGTDTMRWVARVEVVQLNW